MTRILILFWQPGSCGDFVQSALLNESTRYSGVINFFTLDNTGRSTPELKSNFLETVNHVPEQWYTRNWSQNDFNTLSGILDSENSEYFVIPTHCLDEVQKFKNNFTNAVSVGLTYPKNMFPIVLKNWCQKVATVDLFINKIYNQPVHDYFRDKNVFGEFILSEFLTFGSKIRDSVPDLFDINISLEKIYAADVSVFKDLIINSTLFDVKFKQWIKLQGNIQQYNYPINAKLKEALGYNTKASNLGSLDLKLDKFDNIMIKKYFLNHYDGQQLPAFRTLQDANNFFFQRKS